MYELFLCCFQNYDNIRTHTCVVCTQFQSVGVAHDAYMRSLNILKLQCLEKPMHECLTKKRNAEKTITEVMKIYGTGISVYLYVLCECVFFCVGLFKIWISPLTFQMVFISFFLLVFFSFLLFLQRIFHRISITI